MPFMTTQIQIELLRQNVFRIDFAVCTKILHMLIVDSLRLLKFLPIFSSQWELRDEEKDKKDLDTARS